MANPCLRDCSAVSPTDGITQPVQFAFKGIQMPDSTTSSSNPTTRALAGLGLRRALLRDLQAAPSGDFDFLELAPENWLGVGGAHGKALHRLAQRYPLYCHGLSLSLGGIAPLDEVLLRDIRLFMSHHN